MEISEDVDSTSKVSVSANLETMVQRKGSALVQILRVQAIIWRWQNLPDTQQIMQQQCPQSHC